MSQNDPLDPTIHSSPETVEDPIDAIDLSAANADQQTPALASNSEELQEPVQPQTILEQPLFESYAQPKIFAPKRSPHLGHLGLLAALASVGTFCAVLLMILGAYLHWFGVTSIDKIGTEIHFMLGGEAVIYLVTLLLGIFIFPMFWHKSFFAGIHWHGECVRQLRWQLPLIAAVCFGLAMLDGIFLPGPDNAPIEQMIHTPGAAWLMFFFGISFAPFFEEMAFRGFLLPALATACDWLGERFTKQSPRPLDEEEHPQWSLPAMAIASALTSLAFAGIHAEQQGHSIGPFLLLVVVSLVLCAVRLKTRSLAASTLVHACYNCMLFTVMLISSSGFRHLDKM
jgi:membrane protease YdiL (CAAX protease family)